MGLLRKLAKRAVETIVGTDTGGKAAPTPPPPNRSGAAHADPPSAPAAPKPAPAAAVPPKAAAPKADAPKPPPRATAARAGGTPSAEKLATIEASAQEVKERIEAGEPVLLLDVREPFETAGGIVPGARLIPLGQLAQRWKEVADANEVVCYCAAGVRSLQAAQLLRDNGVFNATSLVGGISEWMAIGGSVVRPG